MLYLKKMQNIIFVCVVSCGFYFLDESRQVKKILFYCVTHTYIFTRRLVLVKSRFKSSQAAVCRRFVKQTGETRMRVHSHTPSFSYINANKFVQETTTTPKQPTNQQAPSQLSS